MEVKMQIVFYSQTKNLQIMRLQFVEQNHKVFQVTHDIMH